MGWDSSQNWHEHRHGGWHGHRHGGNWWIAPLVIIGLIVLTHGWILVLPLIAIAAFGFFGFVLPKLAWHMNQGDWNRGGWNQSQWNEMKHQRFQEWGEKRKRHFQNWGGDSPAWGSDKSKRKNTDDIEYV
jgi:hypothetical protein